MMSLYEGRLGNAREAESIAREAVAAAEQADNDRLLAEALTRLGTSVLDKRSREATEFYVRALSLFRTVGDLAGTAALNLGVLQMQRGQLDHASERFEQAHELFSKSSNEGHRLVTLYNMANLARESEDWSTAATLYEQVMSVAARIGQPDVELGARAGQALASLAVGSRSVAEEAMRWIRTNVEPRPEWWFQGRDLVDSLRIRLAADRGDEAHAMRLLNEADTIAGKYDPYAAVYLVAECGPSLRRNADALLTLIDQIMPEVEAQGFAGVARRLSVLRLTLSTTSVAA